MKDIARTLAVLFTMGACASAAWAQSSCDSDGVPTPGVLFERFISADCEDCWADPSPPAPSAGSGTLVLDWIVPGSRGEDAPLSAAATRDALARLEVLGRSVPARTDVHVATVQPPGASAAAKRLRVGRGPVFNDYVGVTVAFAPAPGAAGTGPWTLELLLVEAVPAGVEGSAVPRNLVRNTLQRLLDGRKQLSKEERLSGWSDVRPMRVPEGADPARLQVVAWVQDAQGRAVAAARSVCR